MSSITNNQLPVSKAYHRLFNIVLTTTIILSLHSQAFAQKVALIPNKKVTAAAGKKKKKTSIDQQILAQAQSLQGNSVKIYSDDAYKASAKKKTANRKSNRNSVAQAGGASTFGPSTRVDLDDMGAPASLSTTMAETKKPEEQPNVLNGKVALTVGHDSNLDEVDRTDIKGGYFEMKPSISYKGKTFSGSFGAAIKDFSDQQNSKIAKKTDITADVGATFSLAEDVSTTSKVSFLNRDFRWPDFFNGTEEGMAIRFFETKFTQSADFKLNKLSVNIAGSYSNRDFTNTYSDNAPDILGRQAYQRDLNDAELSSKFDFALNKNFNLIAKPSLKHRKYKKEPARQTDGQKGGAALAATTPVREILVQDLTVDLKSSLGAFTITPSASVGQEIDRALGAEDTSYSAAGMSVEITIDKDLGLTLGGSANVRNIQYDNWTSGVQPAGEKREIDGADAGLSASVNLSKTVGLGVDYVREKYKSNIPNYTDENYTREVIGTTLTVSF